MKEILIDIQAVEKQFSHKKKTLYALRSINLHIYQGETLALIGESGCGKTTLGHVILQLKKTTAGKIFFRNIDLCSLSAKQMKPLRRSLQIIFQNPYASLTPRSNIQTILEEPLKLHYSMTQAERKTYVENLLQSVGLSKNCKERFPYEFSGGQQQRVSIARALALNPEFIVCDEPLSSLDMSMQAQIIDLLKQLQHEKGLTFLFISHDLATIRQLSHRVAVMYLGSLVELTSTEELFNNPLHPYTQSLLSAIPTIDPEKTKTRSRIILKGELPNPFSCFQGCVFASRCPLAIAKCHKNPPPKWREVKKNHFTACHLVD